MLPAQLESLHDLARASDDIAPDHRDAAEAALAEIDTLTAEVDRLSREVVRQREAIRTASDCLSAVADAVTHEEVREALRNLAATLKS